MRAVAAGTPPTGAPGPAILCIRPISADLHMELETWFSQNGLPPREYVLGLFAKHDVVLLGEQHRIRHDVLFIQELLRE